jgi:WS/DGAT/MGAT family acyltransferase
VEEENSMQQLTGADSIFLSMETDRTHGHVGGLSILDPSEAPDFSIDKLIDVMEERMAYEPRFSMKLKRVPYGLDKPYLVEDPDFDIRNHVHRIAAPSPGGLREVAELLGYLHAQKLDLDRPLWEMWIIEGLEDGKLGTYMKTHHALMDGASSSSLGEVLCDLEPEPKQPFILPKDRRQAKATTYSDFEIGVRAARAVAQTPRKMASMVGNMLRAGVATSIGSWLDSESPPPPNKVPKLPFNAKVGKRRGFVCSRVSLADIKAVKNHFDVTVNDVVLAVSGTAVREYLQDQGEFPEEQLVAMIAISTREEGDTSAGNQVTSVPVGWATDIEDPVERLLQSHRNAEKAKDFARTYDADMIAGMGDALPPALADRMMSAGGDSIPLISNLIVSNVRGAPIPLYTAGAKMESMYPMSVLMDTQGLNLTVVSYLDHVDFGFTLDPDLVPDAWSLADKIPGAIEELVKAIEHHPAVRSRMRSKKKAEAKKQAEKRGKLRVA